MVRIVRIIKAIVTLIIMVSIIIMDKLLLSFIIDYNILRGTII